MKKVLSLVIALALLLAVSASALTVSAPGEFPIVDEPYSLNIWVARSANIEDYDTNETTLWYEQKTGVHINWTQVGDADAGTQKTLSLASGNYPDIYSTGFGTDEILQYGINDGILIPLEDLIAEYAPNIQNVLDTRPDIVNAITAPDGHIYCLYRTDPATYTLVRNKLYVNHDWLYKYMEDTGSEAPVTTDEFEEMLIYWRDNDMNGNGDPNDEIPMIGTLGSSGGDFTVYLLNAFVSMPESHYLMATEDQEVYCVANNDEYREGLKWIRHLYEEGLIAEETFIQDNSQLQSLANNNDPTQRTVGAFGGFWSGVSVNPAGMDNAYDVYDPLAPLEGPEGVRQCTTSGILDLFLVGGITKACEHPEIAIKWLDFWSSNEGMVMIDYGFENVNWEWNDTPAINGSVPSRFFLTNRNVLQNTTWYVGSVPYYRTEESLFGRTPTDHVPYLYEGAKCYEDFYTITNFPNIAWCNDVELLTEYNGLKILFDDYFLQSKVQFITGAKDINSDDDWNSYLATLDSMNLDRYMEVTGLVNFG